MMATRSLSTDSFVPRRWSWYLPTLKNTIFDPHGDVLLVLSRGITSSAIKGSAGATPTERGEGVDGRLEASAEQPNEAPAAGALISHEIEARVSSKHLALASRVFRVMFNGNFREGIEPGLDRSTRVPLPEDDADAMLVLLGIIHGLNRNVPQKIDYALFFAIIILIDKYELQEVTGVWTDIWFSHLWPSRDTSPEHLPDWIYICWVLRRSFEYPGLTRTAILWCTSRFEENGLPFPSAIARQIESSRLSTIEETLNYLNKTVERYQGEVQQCLRNSRCDALVLGDLIRNLKVKGLYPVPQAAALDMSITDLFSRLRVLEFSSLCQIHPPPELPSPYFVLKQDAIFCGVSKPLEKEISRLEKGIKGLTLPFFNSEHGAKANH